MRSSFKGGALGGLVFEPLLLLECVFFHKVPSAPSRGRRPREQCRERLKTYLF